MELDEAALAARLRQLEDREEIRLLITDFRRYVDTGDYASFAGLFWEDGELVTNLGPPATGPAEIETLLRRTLEPLEESNRTFHHVTNTAIHVDGETATGTSNWSFITRGDGDTPVVSLLGHYDDVFTRRDGIWKFQRREVYVDIPFTPLDRSQSGAAESAAPAVGARAASDAAAPPDDIYLVFSRPSDRVSEREFNDWYDHHIDEILKTPGFLSAQRYRLTPIVYGSDDEAEFRFLVVYETEGDINELRAALDARVASGEIVLPEWFGETRYLTWACRPLGARAGRR